MTIYQKAIKVRKYCENKILCDGCIYRNKCSKSKKLIFTPVDEDIETVARAIKEEKWKVK